MQNVSAFSTQLRWRAKKGKEKVMDLASHNACPWRLSQGVQRCLHLAHYAPETGEALDISEDVLQGGFYLAPPESSVSARTVSKFAQNVARESQIVAVSQYMLKCGHYLI